MAESMGKQAMRADAVEAALAATAARVTASVAEVRSGGHGAGAGTIWRRDGAIITNHHVVAGNEADVILTDGRRFSATVAARDERNDLALLRVPANDLPAIPLGDARTLRPGELVLAVGHPFGVRHALSVGVVSVAHRIVEDGRSRELVVADVRLAPGNSGGPLADARGRVVGINAMVAGGLALAVPSHLAERLVQAGTDRRRLGIAVQEVALAPVQQAQSGAPHQRGILVLSVQPSAPADLAGLAVGDILVAVAGRPVPTADALAEVLANQADGVLLLSVLRGTSLVPVTVAPARPAQRAA